VAFEVIEPRMIMMRMDMIIPRECIDRIYIDPNGQGNIEIRFIQVESLSGDKPDQHCLYVHPNNTVIVQDDGDILIEM